MSMNFWFNMKYSEKFMEQNFNVQLPKCMIQLHFPWTHGSWQLSVCYWPLTDISSFPDLCGARTLFYPVGCQKPLLRGPAWPHSWCVLGWIPSFPSRAPLWLCSEPFRSQSDSRSSGEPAAVLHQRKILPFIWGHVTPSDQTISCVFGWLNNVFLLQQEGHFPSASLGSSVTMVQHKISPSTGFCISELSVCEQDGDCSF